MVVARRLRPTVSSVRFRDPAGVVREGSWTEAGIEYADRRYDEADIDVLPPTEPSKVFLVGRNHLDGLAAAGRDPPPHPRLIPVPPSAVVGHGATVTLPEGADHVDFGAELGVVIGRQCSRVSAARADEVIAGYTCVNDLSYNAVGDSDPFKARVKGFDNAKPIGPVLATPEEVPEDPRIVCRVNGETRQSGVATELHYSIDEIIERLTSAITLERGDVISMGTPAGLDALHPGDSVEVEIEGIGVLGNDVAAE